MGFIETAYGGNVNLSNVNVDTYLDMDDHDIIGVKRFLCKDFLGALISTASDNVKETLILDDVSGGQSTTKKFRIPSNFTVGSNIRVSLNMYKVSGTTTHCYIDKYDPDTETYSQVADITTTATSTDARKIYDLSCIGGDLFRVRTASGAVFKGSNGVIISYDAVAVSLAAVWEVVDY